MKCLITYHLKTLGLLFYSTFVLGTTIAFAQPSSENLENVIDLPRDITSYNMEEEGLLFRYDVDTPGLLSIFVDSVSEDGQLDLQVMLYDDQNYLLNKLDLNPNDRFSNEQGFLLLDRGNYVISIQYNTAYETPIIPDNYNVLVGSSWISFEESLMERFLGKSVQTAHRLRLNEIQTSALSIMNGEYWRIEVPNSDNQSSVMVIAIRYEVGDFYLEASKDLESFFQSNIDDLSYKILTLPINPGENVVFVRVSRGISMIADDDLERAIYTIGAEQYLPVDQTIR